VYTQVVFRRIIMWHRVFVGFAFARFLGRPLLVPFPNVFHTLYAYTPARTRTTRTHNALERLFRQTRKRVYRTEIRSRRGPIDTVFLRTLFLRHRHRFASTQPKTHTHTQYDNAYTLISYDNILYYYYYCVCHYRCHRHSVIVSDRIMRRATCPPPRFVL